VDSPDTAVVSVPLVEHEEPTRDGYPEYEAEPRTESSGAGHQGVHLPPTSLWPITLAFGITIAASGLVTNIAVSIAGLLLFVLALRGWAQELLDAQH